MTGPRPAPMEPLVTAAGRPQCCYHCTAIATTMPPLGWVDRDGRWVTIVHKLKRRPSKLYIILFLLRHPKKNEKMLISSILPSLILHTSIIHQDYSCNVLLGAMAHNNTKLSD